jgi:nucleoside-diphosphate-sugar epimerase
MSSPNNSRVLLIGGAGFIGHNLALQLRQQGREVIILDSLAVNNFNMFASSNTKVSNRELYLSTLSTRLQMLRDSGVELIVQDGRDYHAVAGVLASKRPQTVVHLAAVSHANISNKDPYSTFDHSLRTLENTLDAARGIAEHFIFLSSSMVYGNFKQASVLEEEVCEPIGIYAALKYAGEKLVIAYEQVFDMPYTIIRPSALYGERCVSRRVGQIFIENAITGKPIKVDGDGEDRLDFTYIDDFCQGVSRVIACDAARNQIFNITYGESRSLKELTCVLREEFPDVEIKFGYKDKLTPDRGTLSVEKARQMIGYAPEFPLEVGYRKYMRWYKEHYRDFEKSRSSNS